MITLAKALKVKNRLVGQLDKAKALIIQYNSAVKGQERPVAIDRVCSEYDETRKRLIELKGKIAVATGPITPKLVEMAEVKSAIAFLSCLSIKEGLEDKTIGYRDTVVKTEEWVPYISEAERQRVLKDHQYLIETLQDQVDEFNAVTKIDFE